MNLFLALAAEHKQRTGHDVFRQRALSGSWQHCDVCLYLDAERRAQQEAESRYYEQGAAHDPVHEQPLEAHQHGGTDPHHDVLYPIHGEGK